MKIIFKYIKNKFLKLFFYGPKLLSTIIFIPFLYICGWILAFPTLLIGLDKESLSLIGTIFTFLIFVFSLPKWFQTRWNLKNTWKLLGIKKNDKNRKLILYFLRGFTISSILVSLILITWRRKRRERTEAPRKGSCKDRSHTSSERLHITRILMQKYI